MGKKSNESSNKPPKEFMPYITGGAQTLNDAYNANSGKIQGYTDDVVGTLLPSLTERFQQGDPGVNAAKSYGTDVLSGKYLDQGNPYLDDIIGRSINDSTNATQAALGLRGLTGGSSYADIISQNAGNIALDARYNDYNQERGRMDAAAGRAGGLAAADYLPVSGLLSTLGASQTPINAASQYAGGLGGLLGGYGTQSQRPSTANSLMQGAGTVASMAALFSERRVKRDICQIGAFEDGLGWYNFRYKWDEDDAPLRVGVMVDEVEKLRPWALGPIVDGIQTVDYGKLENAA